MNAADRYQDDTSEPIDQDWDAILAKIAQGVSNHLHNHQHGHRCHPHCLASTSVDGALHTLRVMVDLAQDWGQDDWADGLAHLVAEVEAGTDPEPIALIGRILDRMVWEALGDDISHHGSAQPLRTNGPGPLASQEDEYDTSGFDGQYDSPQRW